MRRRGSGGFVAIEWVAAMAVLLLPVVVLVGSLPVWAERRHTATIAAREATRVLVREWPAGDPAHAVLVARVVAIDHGLDPADVDVNVVSTGNARGDAIEVRVSVRMPSLPLPAANRVGAWTYTARDIRRVDDYRSR